MAKKISIITINYNNKAGLQKTIDSVFSQTSKDYEFILIDGDSNDGSKELLQQHQDKFTYWVSERDKGIYHAMNKGIRAAKGDYLLFLNSGDYLAEDTMLEKIEAQIDGRYDIYYGDIIFDEINNRRKIVFPEILTFDFFFRDNLSHQSSFIKRELFDQIFYYNEDFKIVSDWEFLIYAICKHNASYKHMDLLTTIYDGSGYSSNPNNYRTVYAERGISLKKHFPTFITDYEQISQLKQRRIQQVLTIKKNPFAWKVLKFFIKIVWLITPKKAI